MAWSSTLLGSAAMPAGQSIWKGKLQHIIRIRQGFVVFSLAKVIFLLDYTHDQREHKHHHQGGHYGYCTRSHP
jgi:hypothetical protein